MMYEVEYKNYITRNDVRGSNNIFVFGDNDRRSGYGGQAKEMRGEPNAVGVRVKKSPSMDSNAFYTDDEYTENVRKINEDLLRLGMMANGKKIIFPSNGIGTGMARLNITAPMTFKYLTDVLRTSFNITNGNVIRFRKITKIIRKKSIKKCKCK